MRPTPHHGMLQALYALLLIATAAASLPVQADPIVTAQNGLACAAERISKTLSCNANDFTTSVTIASASTSCTEGEYFYLDTNVGMASSNADRYDIAFFSGESANDPSQLGGQCSVTTFPTGPDPWFTGGGSNSCGDFYGNRISTPLVRNARVLCQGNTNGELLLPYTVTWQPNNNSACTGPLDVIPGSTSKCVSGTATLSAVIVKPQVSAYYRFDEASWNGTSAEVKDSGGNALHGTAYGGATTAGATPAISGDPGTCRYGIFDGNNNYVSIPNNAAFSTTDELTVSAWIRPASIPTGSTLKSIVSKDTNYEFHLNSSGQLYWWWQNSSGTARTLTSTGAAMTANNWYHVAITYSRSQSSQKIFVNGVERASSTRSEFLATNSRPIYIGADIDSGSGALVSSRFFEGMIDEVRIYNTALNAAQINAVKNETHPCPASVSIDHFRFYHDGTGLTCSPESVQIVACADTNCTVQYPSPITATLAPSGWVGGDTQIFNSAAILQLRHTTASTIALGITSSTPTAINPVRCYIGAAQQANCNLTFYDSGFIFDVPNHSADTTQNVLMSAVRKDLTSEQCVPGFQNVSKTVNFWSNYLDPLTGTLAVIINSSNIATSSPGTGINLNFDANGQTTLQVRYADVGQMRLSASYNGSGTDAGLVMTGEDIFVSKPDYFAMSIPGNPAAADATGAVFKRAGENFTINVEARNASNAITPNYGREAVPESVGLTPILVAPVAGNNPALAGSFGSFGQDCAGNPAAAGTACGSFNWPEVGIITLTPQVADTNYLGAGNVTGTASGNVGRFVPASFAIDHAHTPTCSGAFTYAGLAAPARAGQPFGVTGTVTARNIAGSTTLNYVSSFAKLIAANISAAPRQGAAAAAGTLSWGVDSLSFTNGVGSFAENAAQYAFTAEGVPQTMHLRITATDSDGVAGSQDDASKSVEYRFGRVRLQNAYGPELLALSVPFQSEYLTAVGYVVNSADGCTAPTLAGHLQLSNPATAGGVWQPGTTAMTIGGGSTSASLTNTPFLGGIGGLSFSAPGAGNTGYVDIRSQFAADLPWLLYDWDGDGAFDDEATARANFGLYKGSNTQIYLRERY